MRSWALFGLSSILMCANLPVIAQTSNQIQITVHTSQGDRSHTAPALGLAPVSLERAMQGAGIVYTATWFPSVPGYAAMIIDGDPDKTTGSFETPFWWACVNGFSSAAGLQTSIKGGDQVEWFKLSAGKCPSDAAH
ncbi:MAG TPA: hypothetical protein VFR21_09020 [Bradyrhizobium sp.]|jgi:hypothetical protein|nr:hypothetical protein [Bradyrhizobium sp.]